MAHRIYKFDKQQGTTMGWHDLTEIKDKITLQENWLREWDYTPVMLQKHGQDTKWRILECSDVAGLEVGAAYNSETFQPITNVQFLGLVEQSITGTDHKIVSVLSVRNRGRVAISVELVGKEKFIAAGREFGAYLNFGHGNDKSSVLWVNTSNICTVCDNTFSANLFAVENARSESSEVVIRQRHVPNAVFKFPAMAGLIDKAVGVQAEFALAMNQMDTIPCASFARDLFAGHVGRQITPEAVEKGLSTQGVKKVDRLVELFQTGRGNHGETLADAVSAVTDFYTHESVRSGDKARQFASSEFESGAQVKREFFNTVRVEKTMGDMVVHGYNLLTATK